MFVHKDMVDSQGVMWLMKIGSMLILAGLSLSVYAKTPHMGEGILGGLAGDRGFQGTLKLLVFALVLWAGISIAIGMIMVYKLVGA